MDTPFAVISDVHGNSPALTAVLDDIAHHDIGTIYSLGDVVNGVDPAGSVSLVLNVGAFCIRGNAEEMVCSPGLTTFQDIAPPGVDWALPKLRVWADKLGADRMAHIKAWPETHVVNTTWMVHDSPVDRKNFAVSDPEMAAEHRSIVFHGRGIGSDDDANRLSPQAELVRKRGCSLLLCGHTHVPFVRSVDGIMICNAGSAGMPLDGDPRPSWVSVREERCCIHRVDYDLTKTLRMIAEDSTPHPDKRRYARMFETATHWREL